MLDVRRLRLLRELASRGTIAAVGEACSLTPSAVSQQLSQLRREVGAPLLVRDGRRVLLTDAAQVLVAHTERVLAELEAAQASVAALSGSVAGSVRIGAFATASSALVPPALTACRQNHPDLKIVLEEWETPDGIEALKAGSIDVLLTYEYNLLPKISDPGVELTPLLTESLLATVPQQFDAPPGQLSLRALRDEHWIAPRSDTALRATLERACGFAGFAPDLDFTSDDYTVLLALVSAGLGVSLVPQLAVEGQSTAVRLLPVGEPLLAREVSVAVRAGTQGLPSLAVLIGALRDAAAQLGLDTARPTRLDA